MKRTSFTVSERQALEAFTSQSYLVLNKSLLEMFGPNTAVFLANMLDRYMTKLRMDESFTGWFPFSMKEQEKRTGMTSHEIRVCKKKCETLGIIRVERRGNPSRDFYNPRIQQLLKFLTTSSLNFKGLVVKNFNDYNYINIINNNTLFNKHCPGYKTPSKSDTEKPPISERNKKYLPLAKYLSEIIKQTKNIEHSPTQIKQWTNEFRRLSEENNITVPRIKKALQWYKINVGGEYIPVVESGISFRNKFSKLEDAIQRQSRPKPSYTKGIAIKNKGFEARPDDVTY